LKKTDLFLTVAFCLSLVLALPLFLWLPKQDFSAAENRYLSKVPAFSLQQLTTGDFLLAWEKHLTDHFPARSLWVAVKSGADALAGKREIGEVYLGAGRLFEKKAVAPERFATNLEVLSTLAASLAGRGIPLYFLPVPSAVTLYPESTPPFAPFFDEADARQKLKDCAGLRVIDALPELAAAKQNEQLGTASQLYFRTDHHWTQSGAHTAYLVWARELGLTPVDWQPQRAPDDFLGMLHAKAPLPWLAPDPFFLWQSAEVSTHVTYPDTGLEADSPYILANLAVRNMYTVFCGGNNSEIIITNNAATAGDANLLVLGDSFALSFLPFLQPHYDTIRFIDLRYFRDVLTDYLTAQQISEVLLVYNLTWFAADERFSLTLQE
jgi:hypothetical protein